VKSILRANSAFLLPYLLFLILGGALLLMNDKASIHLEFNAWHSPFFNTFFHYFTHLGDGYTALIIVLLLLALKFRYALQTFCAIFFSGLITQSLKHTVYKDYDRPVKFFEGVKEIYLVPGVENNFYNSFPSGHSTCAFALCFSLALIAKSKGFKIFYFTMALLIGYSRIYLSQHFFMDVYAGSIIGVVTALLMHCLIMQTDRPWLDRSIRKMKHE
jgi:membrane-associated phospholipid phosphatase